LAYGVVYCVRNLINDKEYIGITTRNEKQRFKEHCKADSYLGNAIRKYGEGNFQLFIIDTAENSHELMTKEIDWIKKLGTFRNGYNQTIGGDGVVTIELLEIKLSAKQKRFLEWVKKENQKPINVNNPEQMIPMVLINLMEIFLIADIKRDKQSIAKSILNLNPVYLKEVLRLGVINRDELDSYAL